MNTFGMPGPGGSLGECALCGKPFLKEILMGDTVKTGRIDGVAQTLSFHADCLKTLQTIKEWSNLPPGPLRTAWEAIQ